MVLYRVSVPVLTWDNYWVEADSPEEAFKKVNIEDSGNLFNFNKSVEET